MGKAWKFGENLNTDEIIPGRFNITIDPLELAKNVFCEIKPEYAKNVKPGMSLLADKISVVVRRVNMRRLPSKAHKPSA